MNIKNWSFGNDELFDLVKSGRKTATCSLYFHNNKIPKLGEVSIIKNSIGEKIKIKLTNVSIRRFCDIDSEWAKKEGEGNLSLNYWQKAHELFIKERCTTNNITFTQEIELLCEEFKIINNII